MPIVIKENTFIWVDYLQLKTAINRAATRNDMLTVRDALEVSAEIYRKDSNNVPDYVQRHLLPLSIWDELRYDILSAHFFVVAFCLNSYGLIFFLFPFLTVVDL